MAWLTGTGLVGVHTWVTDGTDLVTLGHSALGVSGSSTLGVLGVPVGSRFAHSALTLLLTEETSDWAILTVTERVGVETGFADVTGVVGAGLVLVLTETESLTVLEINSNVLAVLVLELGSTGFSVDGHDWLSTTASETLGSGTSDATVDLWSGGFAVETVHSGGVLGVLGTLESRTNSALLATVTSITVDTGTAHHVSVVSAFLALNTLQEVVLTASVALVDSGRFVGLWSLDRALTAVGDLGASGGTG